MESKKGVSKGVVICCIVIVFLVVSIVAGAFYIYYGTPEEVYQETFDKWFECLKITNNQIYQ